MKPKDLLLRIYGERSDDQWSLICLEFSLAAQADTLEDAQRLLSEQIVHYLRDATVGQDRAHADVLLRRPAPAKYWLKFWWHQLVSKYFGKVNSTHRAVNSPLPVVPAMA